MPYFIPNTPPGSAKHQKRGMLAYCLISVSRFVSALPRTNTVVNVKLPSHNFWVLCGVVYHGIHWTSRPEKLQRGVRKRECKTWREKILISACSFLCRSTVHTLPGTCLLTQIATQEANGRLLRLNCRLTAWMRPKV